ncbi:MAG: GntR family transcriptional regulator [Candidatus Omnitrophota bacterium]
MGKNNSISPVNRASLTDQVLNNLRQAILNGKLKPGQRIIEEDVAAMMQTSRGPVRDALIQMEHEGLVIRNRNCGSVVANPSSEDMEEVWSLRVVLENMALRYAVQRATETDIARLEQCVQRLGGCLRKNFSLKRAVDLDLKIHEELMNISRHKRLISVWQGLKSQIWFLIFSRNVFDEAGFPRDSDVEHRKLISAIRKKNLAQGTEHLKTHLGSAYTRLLKTYKRK